MRSNNGAMVFVAVSLIIAVAAFGLFYMQFLPDKRSAIKCENDWSTISFLIDEEQRSIVMAGEPVSANNVKIFNETAISAGWKHASGETKIFLDRISGRLEVQTRNRTIEWDKNEFECTQSQIRF